MHYPGDRGTSHRVGKCTGFVGMIDRSGLITRLIIKQGEPLGACGTLDDLEAATIYPNEDTKAQRHGALTDAAIACVVTGKGRPLRRRWVQAIGYGWMDAEEGEYDEGKQKNNQT